MDRNKRAGRHQNRDELMRKGNLECIMKLRVSKGNLHYGILWPRVVSSSDGLENMSTAEILNGPLNIFAHYLEITT